MPSIRSHGRRGSAKGDRSGSKFDCFPIELEVFLKTCELVDTPRSLACWLLAKSNEWGQYLDLAVPDRDSATFADDYLVTEMLSKHPSLPHLSIDRNTVALEKWYAAEHSCASQNQSMSARDWLETLEPDVQRVLLQARLNIEHCLGKLRRFDLEVLESAIRHGPGATTAVKGRNVVPSRKMTSVQDVSPRLYPYWRSLIPFVGGDPIAHDINIVGYNQLTFVPKTSKTDRVICIEPHLNIQVQLGTGALLRSRLQRVGIDLDSQAERNRAAAARAERFSLSTIDLSSASDSIAYEVVNFLFLDDDWRTLLKLSRSEYTLLPDDSLVRLEKFSSMGNGYTFELETLIFWSLALACGSRTVEVFGDDIIVDSDCASLLLSTLRCLGFSVNVRKTFLVGKFFESCGVDFHCGMDVRPFYLKGKYADETAEVIEICNKISLYSRRRTHNLCRDLRFRAVWELCSRHSPRAARTGIPLGYGTSGLIVEFDEFAPSKLRYGHEGYLGVVWSLSGVLSKRTDVIGAYGLSLWKGSNDISRNEEMSRGRVTVKGLKTIPVHHWDGPGPWAANPL